jgi:hypothetical protein
MRRLRGTALSIDIEDRYMREFVRNEYRYLRESGLTPLLARGTIVRCIWYGTQRALLTERDAA